MSSNRPDTEGDGAFSVLTQLLGGDIPRLLCVLRAFRQVAEQNLRQLDSAMLDSSVSGIREHARHAAMTCYAIGETASGRCLDTVSTSSSTVFDPVLMQRVMQARLALVGSISRASVRLRMEGEAANDGHSGDL